ncbi:cell surface glycoprotein [Streptomyces halstedii]|uniref:Cell surface glycoprotein n=1 Tax=Streptomyces halstedii TaxID=1944 RepID=A0A6N9UCF7_STRHA|nr:cell surface glycoprotein [Streptomyces halstedii]NEA19843.1 cell surface glycoprotein [Streptomyces halstedii]
MIRAHVAMLLAYVDKLDPSRAPIEEADILDRLDAWAEVLDDVEAKAPHPDGRDWNAAHAVRKHIATSPYPIKASDVSRPWHAFKADLLRRHTGTFDPHEHPELDPDDPHGNAYVAAQRAELHAVATGQRPPTPVRAIAPPRPGPVDLTEDDVKAMRQQGDLIRHMKAASAQARADNARRKKLVARYPDLNEQIHALPGHRTWSGSVGSNARTAAIVAEAEQRAAGTTREDHAA